MTILDTDKPLECGSCKKIISPAGAKVVLGYGSLVIIMHAHCWLLEEILRK